MLNFKVHENEDLITKHLQKNMRRVMPILETLVKDNSDILNDVLKNTVLNGLALKVRTGKTKSEGFQFKLRKDNKKGANVSGHFWARISNLFENFKNRQRIYITRIAKKVFSKISKADDNFKKAVEEFTKE